MHVLTVRCISPIARVGTSLTYTFGAVNYVTVIVYVTRRGIFGDIYRATCMLLAFQMRLPRLNRMVTLACLDRG